MATSVGSSAAFTSLNMKPSSGEQIDAIWGQNISDNTAFLRSQRHFFSFASRGTGPWVNERMVGGTGHTVFVDLTMTPSAYLCRQSGHNRLIGTVRFDGTCNPSGAPDYVGTSGIYFFGDLGTYGGTTTFSTANIGGTFYIGSTFAFELSLDSYLSVGSWGTLMGYFYGTGADGGGPEIFGTFGEPKFYTTWAN